MHKILIADDDIDFRETIQIILIRNGFKTETVGDGAKVLDIYKQLMPDFTLLDIKMPNLNGYEVFKKIKQFDPNAKVIFLSGLNINSKDYEDAKSNGVLGYLTKPVKLKEILTTVKKYVK